MGRLIRKDTGAVVAEFSPKGQIREVVAEAPGGGRLVRTREASAPRTFQTVSDTPEIKGLSLPTLEDAVKGKERAARTAEANARRGVSASNTGGTPTTAQLMEQARQAAVDLDTDTLNRVNAQLKGRRAAAGKQTAGDRVNDTLSSIFSGSGASYTNLLGTAAATAGEVSDLWTGDPKNIARHRADETRKILRTGRLTDGRAVTPGMIPQLEAALAKYEAEYKAAEPLKPYEERHPILSAAEKALYGAADQMQDESAAYLEGAKKGLGAVGSTVVDAAASMGQSTIDGIAGGVTGLGMAPFVARAFGGAAQEARRGGADLDQQLRYGTAQAAKEYITEKLFGLAVPQGIMGSAGAGSLDDTIEKGIRNVTERLAKTPGGQKVIGGILTWLAGGATEGLEEGIGSVLENTLINPHLRLWDPDTRTGQQKFEDGLYDMLVGGISGLMGVTNLMNYQPGAGATTTLENTDPQTVRRDAQKPAQNVLREGEAQGPTQAETPLEGALGAKEAAPGTGTANKGETVQIVQRLQENIPQLSKERHVHTVSSDALETIKGATMAEKARTLFDGIKGFVTRRGFGEVEINNRSVKDDLSHGVGPAKAAVIPAIPDVIQSGVQIDFQENWKGRPYDGYVFAAPVVMDGETVYVAAVVKQTSKNRFYLHEVVDSNGGIIKIDSGERANQTSLDAIDGAGTQSPLPNQGSPTTVDEIQTSPGQTSETSSGSIPVKTISQPAGEINGGKIQQTGGLNDGEGTGGTVPAETGGRETGAPGRTGGDGVSDGGPERDGGMGAGEQAGSLGGGPGRDQKAVDQGTAAIKRQDLGKTLRGQKVSSRSLGIPGGTDAAAVTVIPESAWDEGLRNTARKIEQETGKHTIFVLGRIPVTGADGRPRNVRGVRMESGIILQADNYRASAEQLADHEIFHDLAAENPEIVRALEDRISETMGREELNRVIDAYMDALSGVYDAETATGEELEQAYLNILEEIYADAYAGINAFGTNAGQFGEAVEKTMEERGLGRRGQEIVQATDRTTGPPERFSIGYDEDNRPFVTVEEDILDGVPESRWVRTVKDNLRRKFPEGVTVGRNIIQIDAQSRREMTWSRYSQWLRSTEPEVYADKLRATDNTDEILLASRDYVNEGLNHPRKDDIQSFARGTVQFRVGRNDYTADVVVGNRADGSMVLYDLLNLQPTKVKEKSQVRQTENPSPGVGRNTATNSMDSITQTAGKSKGENQELKGLSLPTLEADGTTEPSERFSIDYEEENWESMKKAGADYITESHKGTGNRQPTPASEDSLTQTEEKSKVENQEPKGLSLPTLEEEKPGPRFSVDDGDADGENRPKTELRTVEQELERLRDLDYQTELLRQGGAAAIRENETKIRRLEKRADRLRGKERSEEKQTPQKRAPKKPVAESKPIIAKRDLRKNLLSVFSIPEGQKAELGTAIDRFADRLLREGVLTERDRASFFDRLYSSGVMTVAADEYFQEGRNAVAGGRIYVNDMIRGDFGEDWSDFRKRAFAAGVYLTNDQSDTGVDVWNQDMSEILPGLFDTYELDGRTVLERIVQIAEEGKDEKVSLAEYTKRLAGEEYVSEREVLDNLERQMDWALRTFAEKADLEIKLRDRTGIKIAQEREKFAEFSHQQREREAMRRGKEREQRRDMMRRQRENRELRELQQRTLKQLQWLNKNRYRAPKELRSAWDEVLGDIDIYAVGAANEMNWSKKYGATWQDLAQMYQEAKKNDPNFLPSKELERIVARLDGDKIADMDVGALQDLYKAAVGLRTEFYNRNNMIGDEQGRMFAEVYAESKREIEEAPERYTGKGLDKFMNLEQLTPMNVLERMGGWNPEGTFYSMAKQLEQGERDARAYTVEAKRQIEDFLTENREWVKRADGQGEDAIWYELEVPELLKLGMGDKPIFGPTIKVYMTPAQKVHLYLESKSTDNLRHMTGGRTFVNRELYSQGKRAEALAQGVTVKLAPETVKQITSDLTEEELALAKVLEEYYNGFASERINRVSNTLYGYDKAVSKNYAPIFTNQNYTKSEIGIYDATAEGVGHLKGRQYAVNPSYNISAFDAFERHIDQTSRFVGMAIPARNWQTLLNWREANNSTGDVITHKWGQEAKRYIENLLTELQGGKVEEKSGAEKLADTVLSNYISSVFGANPSIVFKQAMSFPLAGTYLGWENTPNIAAALRTDDKLINTYTSELAYRLMGYATPETAQLKNNPSKLSENRYLKFAFGGGAITAMDGWTVKSMWRWAENAVRRENSELEIGTREQIDSGQSLFYQEVARRFEEAVSRSQPMYDVMHRSGAMRSSSGIARALTLFKTVPQQQYNMLRQTVAEAQRAKRVYGEKSGEYSEAKKRAGRAVQGVILAGLGIEAINFLNAMLKNGAKRYRDEDEDEMTWASFGKQFLQGFMADNMGMMIGGDLIAEVLGSAVTGDKWYGIETPGITQIQDVLEEFLTGCRNIQKLVRDGYGIVKNEGDLREYFQRHGADYLGALEEGLATVATYFGGVAYNNVKGYALGALRWMSPETETAFQDWLKTADKSGLKGLKDEALETRIYDILKNRTGSAEETTAVELAALYAAGYRAAVPSDTPESVTVNGESRKLNVFQKQLYDSVWKDTVGGTLDEVTASRAFQEADQETREKMLRELYSYAGELAKAEVLDDYSLSTGAEKAREALRSGLDMVDYLALKAAGGVDRYMKASGQGMRPEDAAQAALAVSEIRDAAEEKTPNLVLYREALRKTRDEDKQMAALALLMSEGEYAKLKTGAARGITPEMYVTARESIAEIDGNGSVNQDEAARAIGSMPGLTDEERAVLWQLQNKSWKPDKNPFSVKAGERVYKDLQDGGGTPEKPGQKSSGELKGLSLPSLN